MKILYHTYDLPFQTPGLHIPLDHVAGMTKPHRLDGCLIDKECRRVRCISRGEIVAFYNPRPDGGREIIPHHSVCEGRLEIGRLASPFNGTGASVNEGRLLRHTGDALNTRHGQPLFFEYLVFVDQRSFYGR